MYNIHTPKKYMCHMRSSNIYIKKRNHTTTYGSMDGCVSDRLQWLIDFHEPFSPPCNNRCHAGLKNVQRDHWRLKNIWETEWRARMDFPEHVNILLKRTALTLELSERPSSGKDCLYLYATGPPTTSWTVSLLVVRLHAKTQSSGAVWKWRWPSWAPRPK